MRMVWDTATSSTGRICRGNLIWCSPGVRRSFLCMVASFTCIIVDTVRWCQRPMQSFGRRSEGLMSSGINGTLLSLKPADGRCVPSGNVRREILNHCLRKLPLFWVPLSLPLPVRIGSNFEVNPSPKRAFDGRP